MTSKGPCTRCAGTGYQPERRNPTRTNKVPIESALDRLNLGVCEAPGLGPEYRILMNLCGSCIGIFTASQLIAYLDLRYGQFDPSVVATFFQRCVT